MNVIEPIHWAILLMIAGCGLVVVEIFVPSGGVLGLLSTGSFVAAIIIAFAYHGPSTGFIFLATTVVTVPAIVILGFKLLPHTPLGRSLIGELPEEDQVSPDDRRKVLVGRFGIAKSKMLPSGVIEIEGEVLDAVSQGMAIDAGEPIVVVEVRGNRVVVRRREREEVSGSASASDVLSQPIDSLGLESLDDPLA